MYGYGWIPPILNERVVTKTRHPQSVNVSVMRNKDIIYLHF